MLDRNQTFLVLNYIMSPVCLQTRNDSMMVAGGTRENPGSLSLSLDEIIQINNSSPVFKVGLLWFEPEYAEAIYEELKIRNWKDILTDEQIEDIILHPTMDSMKKILAIQVEFYFERVYGVYMGLRNAGYSISGYVETIMSARRKEVRSKQMTTKIVLTAANSEPVFPDKEQDNALKQENSDLLAEIAALKQQLADAKAVKKTTTTKKKTTLN